MIQTLFNEIKPDVKNFMDSLTDLYFSEAEFQLSLAQYLKAQDPSRKIHLEYYVPGAYTGLDSKNRAYIDIVVEKDGQFVPIELKYKTSKLNTGLNCFGNKNIPRNLISHGATPYNRYRVWEDVKRLESVKLSFPDTIPGGLVIFLTNEPDYWKNPCSGNVSYSILDRANQKPDGILYDKDDLSIKNIYVISWGDTKINGSQFRYCIAEI